MSKLVASRSLIVTEAHNYAPDVMVQYGPHDVITSCIPFDHLIKNGKFVKTFVQEALAEAIAFTGEVHAWSRLVVITDSGCKDPYGVSLVFSALLHAARWNSKMQPRTYKFTHVILNEDRQWEDTNGEVHHIPLRGYATLHFGCLDPRLCQCRANDTTGQENAWFTYPGVGYQLQHGMRFQRRWILENLRWAVKQRGTNKIVIIPHEDCYGHPIAEEKENEEDGLLKAQHSREQFTRAQIAQLKKLPWAKSVDFEIYYRRLNGVLLMLNPETAFGDVITMTPPAVSLTVRGRGKGSKG